MTKPERFAVNSLMGYRGRYPRWGPTVLHWAGIALVCTAGVAILLATLVLVLFHVDPT